MKYAVTAELTVELEAPTAYAAQEHVYDTLKDALGVAEMTINGTPWFADDDDE